MQKKTKKIYYPQLGVHTYMKPLIENPPQGYEFVLKNNEKRKKTISSLNKSKLLVFLYKNFFKKTFNVFGLLNKIYYEESPPETNLILSTGTIIHEKKPWIMKILDTPFCMAGNDYHVFIRNRKKIEEGLKSRYCKKIIVHTKICKSYMERYFPEEVIDKIEVVNPAIPDNFFGPKIEHKDFTFLFIGSLNNPKEFALKGGMEALETFKKLSKRNKNVRLIMRSGVPKDVKEKYSSVKNIEYFEEMLPFDEIKKIYRRSDVLLMPGYAYFIMATLESFMNGIPIISLDTYGMSEFVKDGKTGFCIEPSEKLPLKDDSYPTNTRSKKFLDLLKGGLDKRVISELVDRSEILIKNEKFFKKMKKNCRKEFETIYSFDKKIGKLKNIFDASLR